MYTYVILDLLRSNDRYKLCLTIVGVLRLWPGTGRVVIHSIGVPLTGLAVRI